MICNSSFGSTGSLVGPALPGVCIALNCVERPSEFNTRQHNVVMIVEGLTETATGIQIHLLMQCDMYMLYLPSTRCMYEALISLVFPLLAPMMLLLGVTVN